MKILRSLRIADATDSLTTLPATPSASAISRTFFALYVPGEQAAALYLGKLPDGLIEMLQKHFIGRVVLVFYHHFLRRQAEKHGVVFQPDALIEGECAVIPFAVILAASLALSFGKCLCHIVWHIHEGVLCDERIVVTL